MGQGFAVRTEFAVALLAAAAAGCASGPVRDYTSPAHESRVADACRRAEAAGSSEDRAAAIAEIRRLDGELAGFVLDFLTHSDLEIRNEAALRIAGMGRRARGAAVVFVSALVKSAAVDYELRLGRGPEAQQRLDLMINMLGGLWRLAPAHESVPELLPTYCRYGLEFRERGGFFATYLRTNAIALAEKACAADPALRKACVPALVETALRDKPYDYVVVAAKDSRQVTLDARGDALRVLGGFGAAAAAATPALELLRTHKDEKVRKAAEDTLKAVGG
jgi:hypothetical protein